MLTGCKLYKEKDTVTSIVDSLRHIPYLSTSYKKKLLQLNFPLYFAISYSFPSLSLDVSEIRFLINPSLLNTSDSYEFPQEYQRGTLFVVLSKSLLLLIASIVTADSYEEPAHLPDALSVMPNNITSLHPSAYKEIKLFIKQNEGKKIGNSYIITTKYIPALEEYIAYCEKLLDYWKPSLLLHSSTINETDVIDSLKNGDSVSFSVAPICGVTLNYNKLSYSADCRRAKPSVLG